MLYFPKALQENYMNIFTSCRKFYTNWHSSATLTEFFFPRTFSSVVRQMPGYNSQRRGTARTLPNQFDQSAFESQKAFQPKLLIVLFYVLFVCKYVPYYCHRV